MPATVLAEPTRARLRSHCPCAASAPQLLLDQRHLTLSNTCGLPTVKVIERRERVTALAPAHHRRVHLEGIARCSPHLVQHAGAGARGPFGVAWLPRELRWARPQGRAQRLLNRAHKFQLTCERRGRACRWLRQVRPYSPVRGLAPSTTARRGKGENPGSVPPGMPTRPRPARRRSRTHGTR